MKVLIACEESQAVCKEFRALGHEAYSCDLCECSGGHPEWHIKGDCLPLLNGAGKTTDDFIPLFETQDGSRHELPERWDLIIAHPPCTYMSKAGARWMYKGGKLNQERYELAMEAKDFFYKFINANCDRICIENPTPLKIVGLPEPTQIIQPFEFGEPYSKRTLLWLKFLPPLNPTTILKDYKPYLPSNTSQFAKGKGGSRGVAHNAKDASKTFVGIAKAMAKQWGKLSNEDKGE